MSVDIGGRLRFVRTHHKLSQRELAKRSGVTNSTISLIESNVSRAAINAASARTPAMLTQKMRNRVRGVGAVRKDSPSMVTPDTAVVRRPRG